MSRSLRIIPVLDLLRGSVVRARQGRRELYRELRSPLAQGSSEPREVLRALLQLHDFETLYIADLDALQGGAPQRELLRGLAGAHPGLRLWVDAGAHTAALARELGVTPVYGTESLAAPPLPPHEAPWVLSLDFRDGQPLGEHAPAWLAAPAAWPDDVVVMSLERVGAGSGPDLQRLRGLRELAPRARWHAAGGVRDESDLRELRASGVHGVLLASALHDGRLDAARLRSLER